MTRTINVALVGSKFMGRAHSNAWLNVARFFDCDPRPVMHTVGGRNVAELDAFAERWGWLNATVDWRSGITDDAIDLVDIGTPKNVHAEQAIAALGAGKHVACEKPLAGTVADADAIIDTASTRDLMIVAAPPWMIDPRRMFARQLVRQGAIGDVAFARSRSSHAGPAAMNWPRRASS